MIKAVFVVKFVVKKFLKLTKILTTTLKVTKSKILKNQVFTRVYAILQKFVKHQFLLPLYCCRRLTCYIVNNAVYILDLVYYSVAAALKHFIW